MSEAFSKHNEGIYTFVTRRKKVSAGNIYGNHGRLELFPSGIHTCSMSTDETSIPFGVRLSALLVGLQPPRNQAWLAEKTGMHRGSVSRLVSGSRNPDVSTIEMIATVVGMTPDELVRGTDAEARVKSSRDWVKRTQLDLATKEIAELRQREGELLARVDHREKHLAEAKRQLLTCSRSATESFKQLQQLQHDYEVARTDRDQFRCHSESLEKELRYHRRALAAAVSKIKELAEALQESLGEVKRNSKTTKFFSGVAAAASLATVAALLHNAGKPAEKESDDDDNIS